MDIKTKNAEIVAKVEKELGKHIGTIASSMSRTRTFSGVVTTLGKTVYPRSDLSNTFTITVIFIGSDVDKIVLSHNTTDQYTVIPMGQVACFVGVFARHLQEAQDEA